MKNILIIVVTLLVIFSCNTPGTRKDFAAPNTPIIIPENYTLQKEFNLVQITGGFQTGYQVFEIGEKRFKVKKELSLTKTAFTISDIKSETTYKIEMQPFQQTVVDREIPTDGRIYTISQGTTQIATVTQADVDDFLTLQLFYQDQLLSIEGAIGRKFNNYHNLVYYIRSDDTEYASIYKQFLYFINRYEIRVNEEYFLLEDEIIIAVNVILDTLVREYGFLYKN